MTPLWTKGFRPFFVAAAVHAVLFLPTWIGVYAGWLDIDTRWTAAVWHGHEMVFGFTLAVVAGFLLTAVSNWTGRDTATGKWLAALLGLWVAGRVAVLASGLLPAGLVAAVDLAFIPALAYAVGRPLIVTNNRRNLMFLAILGAFFSANLAMHLDASGVVDDVAHAALLASVDLVVLVVLIIGGRIIPLFTRNALGDDSIRSSRWVNRLVIAGAVAVLATDAFLPMSNVAGLLNVAVGLLVIVRMKNWGTLQTVRSPILWVLHLGHLWVAVGLILRGATALGLGVGPTFATHVLTVGAIGTLTLGMMSRVALGHTGRPLVVARRVAVAFALVTVAVLARAIIPILEPDVAWSAYLVSAAAWTVAFVIYLIEYTPILFGERVAS